MMESPKMFTTLIGKNPDDEASRASDGSMVVKAETYGVRQVAEELENDVSNVNSVDDSAEGKIYEVGVGGGGGKDIVGLVEEGGNLGRLYKNENESVDKGDKCSEVGVEVSDLEHAEGEMKEDAAVNQSFEGLENVPVQQLDLGGIVTKNFEAMEIQVARLTDEEQLPLLKEGAKFAVSGDDFLGKKQYDDQVGSFAIGDIVWCMAKNNIWWPAIICGPSDAPTQATKNWDSEKHLVRHFGCKTVVRCPPSHLKHFLESFMEMSSQGKSKSFLGAIEKAAEEVGRRVKFEMSCSCVSKEVRTRLIGRNKEDFKPWYISNGTVARHFDPLKFLERVKNLAVMSNVLDIVEIVATRSNISAYYSYFGHRQMYLRHLRDTDASNGDITAEEGLVVGTENAEEGSDLGNEKDGQSLDLSTIEESPKLSTEGTAEKGFDSRERKKSKYLSFPFVDPIATKSLRDPTDSSEASGKRSSSSGKWLMAKSSRNFSTTSGELKDLKVSPAQLLTELRDTSRGYFYMNSNTVVNATFVFFCEFRLYTFSDGGSARNWYNENGIFEKEGLEVQDATPLSEIKPTKKRKKSVTCKLEVVKSELTMDQLKDMSLKACHGTSLEKGLTKSRKRKLLTVANQQTSKSDGFLDLNSNDGSLRRHENSLDEGKVTEANSQPKKTKSELENGIIKAKPISLVVDLFIDSHSLAGLLEANVERHFGDTPARLNANTAPIPSLPENVNPANSDSVQTERLPTHINTDKKSEIRTLAKTSSGLPDLNGNGLDPNTSVTSPKQPFHASIIPIPVTHPAARVEEPPLSVIKSNLEMMTRMLDESGNNISSNMRAKLENDVQGLLKKITTMTGSSS